MWEYLAEPKTLSLLCLPMALVLFFLFKRRYKRVPTLLLFSDPNDALKVHKHRTRLVFRSLFAGLLVGCGLLLLAAARPIRIENWTKRHSEGIDIGLVLDVSESMEATDLVPNRMVAAKRVIQDFIRARPDDRIGLTIFGGEAITKCPLTRDHDFLLSQVEDSRMRELKQGTAIGMGLSNGISRLRTSESKTKIIVLITDGDSNVGAINPITAAHLARQEGIKIYSIGIGRENRVVVPIYAYDAYGRRTQLIAQVPSYINPELLAQISRITGGKAYMARDNGMLIRILQEIDRLEKSKVKIQPMQRRHELFFPFAAAGTSLIFLCLILQETRYRRARIKARGFRIRARLNAWLGHREIHATAA